MILKNISLKQLSDLSMLLNQITGPDYYKPLPLLENSTVGRHVRHVIEFYGMVVEAIPDGCICYEDRKRNIILEENVNYALERISEIKDKIVQVDPEKRLLIKTKYAADEILMESSLGRELNYNIEHTVHHLAIIRMAVKTFFAYIQVPETLGFADSTIQYLQSQKFVK